jgi:hypothetical protein
MPFRACSLTYLPASASLRSALSMRTWILFALLISDVVWGQSQRTQSVELSAGWNAVFLEVDPQEPDPRVLFKDLPVDMVTTFTTSTQGAQFVQNPGADLLKAYGWSVWYAPHRSDAFLGDLHAIYGDQSYLIHATSATTWTVEGSLPATRARWKPDAYNLVGYMVKTPGGPTFEQFFHASRAHNHNKIYRLVNGIWQQVLDPGATLMRSGEAFWIYCKGRSDYPGPLEISTGSSLGLFVSSSGGSELVIRNRSAYPLALSLEHQGEGDHRVPLTMPVRAYDETTRLLRTLRVELGGGNWTQELPTLEAGAAIRIPLQLSLKDLGPGAGHSVLLVHTDMGSINAVPVTAASE